MVKLLPLYKCREHAEQSRIIIEFPVDDILADISDGIVPSSSVEYRLRMFNAPHADSTPLGYSLEVPLLRQSWNEGTGLDMDQYSDLGASNWISGSVNNAWNSERWLLLCGISVFCKFLLLWWA